ncbi:MAG TPA: site-2 protease family protein [Chthonomonadaceae bacterium]|nr:site-2 protease family protein [Chthonomonadaceae bacterium]
MFQHFDPKTFLIGLIVIILSIALHEFGHAFSADRLGDDTPRRQGRVTLWPDKHFEPVGFLMIVFTMLAGFGLGWGKPVQVNDRNFRHPNRDMIIVTICGPLMNLLLAVIAGLIMRYVPLAGYSYLFARDFLFINLALMFFNLIPIPPLDGSKVLYGLLPYDLAVRYERFMGQFGLILLLLILFTNVIGQIIGPATFRTAYLLAGNGLFG